MRSLLALVCVAALATGSAGGEAGRERSDADQGEKGAHAAGPYQE